MLSAADRRRSLRRAAAHERDVARAIGSRRTATIGSRRSEADVAPIVVRGMRLAIEAKLRGRLPALITRGLEQARSYARGAVPVVVAREIGGRAIVCMDLAAWCELVGLDVAAMPARHTPTRRDARQLDMFGDGGTST